MIVNVQFKSKYTDGYGGRPYSYHCTLDVVPGDIVKVPTVNGDGIAMVTAVNVPESNVDERILPLLKTITEFYEEDPADGE